MGHGNRLDNKLCGVITALITPMYPSGEIDFDSLTNLVEFQIKNQVDALVVAGSTGEGSMLSIEEKISVLQHVQKISQHKSKIIMGFNDVATHMALSFIKQLNSIDNIDYYLATTPPYVRPTQEGLYQHFMAIAKHSTRPVILYNIPGRTGCDLSNETILRLVRDCNNIVGLKDATGVITRACDLFKQQVPNFAIYSGDDGTSSEFILNGGDGVVSVASNLVPDKLKTLVATAMANDRAAATELNNELQNLYTALSLESNPVALKWALFFLGIIRHASVRLPLLPLGASSQEKMKIALMSLRLQLK